MDTQPSSAKTAPCSSSVAVTRPASSSTLWYASTSVRFTFSPFLSSLLVAYFYHRLTNRHHVITHKPTATKTIELLPSGPTQRHFHVAAIDSQNQMWIHGGKSNGYHNDFYKFNIGFNHSFVRSFVRFACPFGLRFGVSYMTLSNSLSQPSITLIGTLQWSHVVTKNPGPLARFGHSAVGSYSHYHTSFQQSSYTLIIVSMRRSNSLHHSSLFLSITQKRMLMI